MKPEREQEIASRLRAAVDARTPDCLNDLLKAVEERRDRPVSAAIRHPRRPAVRLAAVGLGLTAAAAAFCLLTFPPAGKPHTTPSVSRPPAVSGERLEAAGFVMKAYGQASPGEESSEQILEPNRTVMLNASADGVGIWPSAVARGNGKSLYKIHIPFDVACQGENLLSVSYRTTRGQFERKLVAGQGEETADFASKVKLVNRDETGGIWGYAPLGGELTLSAQEQDEQRGALSLELTLTAEANASAYFLETAFRRLIEKTDIVVTLFFADGTSGKTVLRFGAGPLDGALEATLVTSEGG